MKARFVAAWLGSAVLSMVGAANLAAQGAAQPPAAPVALPDTLDPKLVGNRFRPLTWAEMTEAQKTMTRHVLDGPRTAMSGPFNVMLRSPVMGDLAQELGAQV